MIEARAFSDFMASDLAEVHRKAHLVLNRNPGVGAWATSLPSSSPPVSGAGSAWQSGIRTQSAHSAGKLRTAGEITAHAGVTTSAATTPCGMWSTASPAAAAPSLRSRKNTASCHRVLQTTVTLLLHCTAAATATLQTSRQNEAKQVAKSAGRERRAAVIRADPSSLPSREVPLGQPRFGACGNRHSRSYRWTPTHENAHIFVELDPGAITKPRRLTTSTRTPADIPALPLALHVLRHCASNQKAADWLVGKTATRLAVITSIRHAADAVSPWADHGVT